jgi:hypothetical protein
LAPVRVRFSLPQSRRGLLVAGAILFTVLVASGCGSGGSKDRSLKLARFPGYRLSFRYPSAWERKDWCWIYTDEFPLTLLTTANPVPDCQPSNLFGFGTPLPPPQVLAKDGVAVWLIASPGRALVGVTPNAHVGGRPAIISVRPKPSHPAVVKCVGAGPTRRLLRAQIRGPGSGVGRLDVGAVICGPDFASGLADVRAMLASLRFTG